MKRPAEYERRRKHGKIEKERERERWRKFLFFKVWLSECKHPAKKMKKIIYGTSCCRSQQRPQLETQNYPVLCIEIGGVPRSN